MQPVGSPSGPVTASTHGAGNLTALTIHGLSKAFGGAVALDDVALDVRTGEVHGLLGQNGSGKSTLIKILSGFHAPEPGGRLTIFGKDVPLPLAAGQFRDLGMAFVHQHLGLIPSLSVVENMRLSDFARNHRWRIRWRRECDRVAEIFRHYQLDMDPRTRVADLPQVERCLVAIVRAMEQIAASQSQHGGRGILVLDEPTPFLPKTGVDQLFDLVRQVVAKGASVIFVSHDVDEVREITDRATILRDGKVAGTVVTADASHDDFVELIVGRKVQPFHISHEHGLEESVEVGVSHLSGQVVDDLALSVRKGEVLGLTGLIGAGFEEVPAILSGAQKGRSGSLTLAGQTFDLRHHSPARAIAAGIAYLPADRLAASGAGSLSVVENVALPSIRRFTGPLGLNRTAMARWAKDVTTRHDVRPNRPEMALEQLSGGNQQKVLLAKWLEIGPALLLLDEPTQGIDVGARQQVYEALDHAVNSDTTVICASADYEQLAQICDRVLIFAFGRVIRELKGGDVTKERIAEQCYKSMASAIARAAG